MRAGFCRQAERLKLGVAILRQVPGITEAGRENLDEHLPRTFIATAIDEATGTADFFNEDLVKPFEDVKGSGGSAGGGAGDGIEGDAGFCGVAEERPDA